MEPTCNNIKIPPLKRKRGRKVKPAGTIALLAFFLLCATFGFWLAGLFASPFPDEKKENPEVVYQSDGILNILFLGVDQREDEPSRSDTIILASLHLDDKEVNLLSIPRDTRVEIPGKGIKRRINYAHAVGGVKLSIETVEKFLKVPIDYYAETNFEGFSEALDILGGVTINVEEKMYLPEEGIDLKPGLQKLDGHDALSYVRWRGDGKGDIGRIPRQQKFFRTIIDQSMQFSTIWKIPQLLGKLDDYVETDMKLTKMIYLANKFRDVGNVTVNTYTIPGYPDETTYGASYWIANQKDLDKILEQVYGKKKAENV
ncbi:MAG: LCP family protein [Clostridia bacterium]|nr:LCP family protein [Clostridia bacterium]MDD4047887.1 LCP family protein [Clostridia bacterium]